MIDPAHQRAVDDAVSNLIHAVDPGAMATGYVVLIEVVDSQSIRAVWSFAAEDQPAWDSLGLLEYAKTLEYAEAAGDRGDG